MNGVAYPAPVHDLMPIFIVLGLTLVAIIIILLFLLVSRIEDFRALQASYNKIILAFDELDEQAKLIVKTDLELHRAQEELDRRLKGLDSLQKFARRLSMTLDENEVFQKVDLPLIQELGFSRLLIFTLTEDQRIICRTNIAFDPKKVDLLQSSLETHEAIQTPLKNNTILSSLSSSQKLRSSIIQLFDCEHFILAPLSSQQKITGILFVGNHYNAPSVTEGDEELISILASQLARTIENSLLFEQVYRSSRILEAKVNDRTKELSHALKELSEISKKKSDFISAVSHELRTPLTSIKGYAAILMTGKVGEIPDPVKERLVKINTHSDNLVKLINDLLDIARIESGRVEMRTELRSVQTMIDNIADLLTPQLTAKNIALKTNIPSDVPLIQIDQSQVERVFINLISNAIKFTPNNGTINVNVLPRPVHEDIMFEIADTGIGIKKEDLHKIFDEFYRVENEINMNVKGSGLGLALAKNIVEAHGGRIWVTSEPGAGTTFHFMIPYKPHAKETPKSKILYQVPNEKTPNTHH